MTLEKVNMNGYIYGLLLLGMYGCTGKIIDYEDESICIAFNKDKYWYRAGKLHRVNGPAMETPTYMVWTYDGKFHREDGPAIEHTDGVREWWYKGQRLTKAEWKKKIK